MATRKTKAKQPKGGLFVSFEGGEGSGKSTQGQMLAETLKSEGYDVLATHEPGGSPGGRVVREVLLGGHAAEQGPLAEACLLTSARREHVDMVIRPALVQNKIVVCDRFADSTRIYQGNVGGVPTSTIDQLQAVATDGLMPTVTFILDVSPQTAQKRRKSRLATKKDNDDRFEKENQSFHNKVLAGFTDLAKAHPKRCVLVDGEGKPENVALTIRDILRLRGLV